MTLKSRSVSAIVVAVILIFVAVVIWGKQTGKITIFGEPLITTHSYSMTNGEISTQRENSQYVDYSNGKIKLNYDWNFKNVWDFRKDTGIGGGGTNFYALTPHSSAMMPDPDRRIIILAGHPRNDNNIISREMVTWFYNPDDDNAPLGREDGGKGELPLPYPPGTGGSTVPNYNPYVFLMRDGVRAVGPVPSNDNIDENARGMAWGWTPDAKPLKWRQMNESGKPAHDFVTARAGAAADNCSIYILGGVYFQGSEFKYSNQMDIYNSCTSDEGGNRWWSIDGPFVNNGRDGMAMAYDSKRNRIYTYGGHNGSTDFWDTKNGNFYDDLRYLELTNNPNHTWQQVAGSGKRAYGKMIYDPITDELIYFGGEDQGDYFSNTLGYNINSNSWHEIGNGAGITARAFHDLVYNPNDKKIYAIGGGNDNNVVGGTLSEYVHNTEGDNQIFSLSRNGISEEGFFETKPIGGADIKQFTQFGVDSPQNNYGGISFEIWGRPDGSSDWRKLLDPQPATDYRLVKDVNFGVDIKFLKVKITLSRGTNPNNNPTLSGLVFVYTKQGEEIQLPPPNSPTNITASASSTDCAKGQINWDSQIPLYRYYNNTGDNFSSIYNYGDGNEVWTNVSSETPPTILGYIYRTSVPTQIAGSTVNNYFVEISKSPVEPTTGGYELGKYQRSYLFTGLLPDTTYYAWVRAVGQDGKKSVVGADQPKSFKTGKCATVGDGWSSTDSACNANNKKTRTWTYTKGTGDTTRLIDFGAGDALNKSLTYPIYRFHDPEDHFYTMNENEINSAQVLSLYTYENIMGYAYKTQIAGTDPIYRAFSSSIGDHFYTMNSDEFTSATEGLGFKDEGTMGYAYKIPLATIPENQATDPIYRAFNRIIGDHFYTMNSEEFNTATEQLGYKDEGTMGYAYKDVKTASAEEVSCDTPIQNPVIINGTDPTPPTAPTNLTATPVGNDGVDLSWTASTDNVAVSGYEIFNADNDQLVGTTIDTKFSVKGLSCGTTYKYYVVAHDSVGNKSDKSNVAEAKTGACAPPNSVINGITSLVATGTSLWLNILIALALAAAIAYFLVWRKKRNQEL